MTDGVPVREAQAFWIGIEPVLTTSTRTRIRSPLSRNKLPFSSSSRALKRSFDSDAEVVLEGDDSRMTVEGSASPLGGIPRCQAHPGLSRTVHPARIRRAAENDRSEGVSVEGITTEPIETVLCHRTGHAGQKQSAIHWTALRIDWDGLNVLDFSSLKPKERLANSREVGGGSCIVHRESQFNP